MPSTTTTTELPAPLPGANPESAQWRSIAFSFVLHLCILFGFFWLTYSSGGGGESVEPDRSAGIVLTVQSDPTAEKEYLDETDLKDQETPAEASSSSTSSEPTPDTAPEIESSPSVADIKLPGVKVNNFDANKMTAPTTEGYKPFHELSDADRALIAADQLRLSKMGPAGPSTSLSVFGTGQMAGRSFLFLLDRSTSMGSKGLGVVQVARKELTAAVEKLDSHNKFQILGYNNTTTPMKAPRLLNASRENKLEVPRFISNLTAFGPTNHNTGLISAISYQPDVIVLLTDGGSPGLNEQELKLIRNTAGGRTQIHCVQFGMGPQRVEDEFMGILAAQNGGTFRYVDVNEWQK